MAVGDHHSVRDGLTAIRPADEMAQLGAPRARAAGLSCNSIGYLATFASYAVPHPALPRIPMTDDLSNATPALRRLIAVARQDTGQARRVANFLLAWWDAESCGGFDLTDLWNVDDAIAADMLTVFAMLAQHRCYPYEIDPSLRQDFEHLVADWRPNLG